MSRYVSSLRFVAERHGILGPDLATAHFLVMRGAMVKFVGRNTWFKKDKAGNTYLPNQFVPGMHLEAIITTGMQMSHVAFDNMSERILFLFNSLRVVECVCVCVCVR